MSQNMIIFDIGKTHTKVILYDLARNAELTVFEHKNQIKTTPPYPHIDVETIKNFALDALRKIGSNHSVDAIFVSAHGAAVALMKGNELILPVLDYECDAPDSLAQEYDRIRPDFSQTGTPRMGAGLNLGAQLYWLNQKFPHEFALVDQMLFWPQFWSFMLCGTAASEIAYASCHGDLWDIGGNDFIPLTTFGIHDRAQFPPLRSSAEVIGTIQPEIAQQTGLSSAVKVYCGGHDSSLSLVKTTLERPMPCTVLSTGTWITIFALGNEDYRKPPQTGMMISMDCFGNPVLNFRFQGGQIYADRLSEASQDDTMPFVPHDIERLEIAHFEQASLSRLIDRKTRETIDLSRWPRKQVEQVASHLLALQTLKGLEAIGARGEIICSGPFAQNATYLRVLRDAWSWPIVLEENRLGLCDGIAALTRPAD